jgi:hypothetical protein
MSSLFTHDAGIPSLGDYLTVLVFEGKLGDDKHHATGAPLRSLTSAYLAVSVIVSPA